MKRQTIENTTCLDTEYRHQHRKCNSNLRQHREFERLTFQVLFSHHDTGRRWVPHHSSPTRFSFLCCLYLSSVNWNLLKNINWIIYNYCCYRAIFLLGMSYHTELHNRQKKISKICRYLQGFINHYSHYLHCHHEIGRLSYRKTIILKNGFNNNAKQHVEIFNWAKLRLWLKLMKV